MTDLHESPEGQEKTPGSVGAEQGAGHENNSTQNPCNIKSPKSQAQSAPSAAHPAIMFLRAFYGEQPNWDLSVIKEGNAPEPYCFFGKDREARALDWIERMNKQGFDVYFNPNPLKEPLTRNHRKARKDDVAQAKWLYVDYDPPFWPKPPREPKNPTPEQRAEYRQKLAAYPALLDDAKARLPAWREEKLRQFNEGRPEGLPPPTWFIDSGRGFWRYWKLANPAEVDGHGPKTWLVENRGNGIELAFGKDAGEAGDDCRNIDRLARLPGMVNHRTGMMAKIIEHHPERVYALEDFPLGELDKPLGNGADKSAEHQRNDAPKGNGKDKSAGPKFKFDPEFTVDALPADLRDMIKNGKHPKDKYKTRSGAVFGCIMKMINQGCELGDITNVLLKPEYKISEHVLEQNQPRQYAIKQVEKAWGKVELLNEGWIHKQTKDGHVLDVNSVLNRTRALELVGIRETFVDTATEHSHIIGPEPFANGYGPNDAELVNIAEAAVRRMGVDFTTEHFTNWRPVLEALAERTKRDLIYEETIEMIERGKERMNEENKPEMLFIKSFGLTDNAYNRAAGKHLIRDTLAMRLRPAFRAGAVIPQLLYVLYGPENDGKSTFVKILAGGCVSPADSNARYTDTINIKDLTPSSTHGDHTLHGKLAGVTAAEFADTNLGTNVGEGRANILKHFTNKGYTEYRPMNKDGMKRCNLRCVRIFTTNKPDIMNESMGERRWIIVDTSKSTWRKKEDLRNDLKGRTPTPDEQLLLQNFNPGLNWLCDNLEPMLAHMHATDDWKGQLSPTPDMLERMKGEQKEYVNKDDPWMEPLADIQLDKCVSTQRVLRISSSYILFTILNKPMERRTSADTDQLKTCMRQLGWIGPKVLSFGCGRKFRGYERKATDEELSAAVQPGTGEYNAMLNLIDLDLGNGGRKA